MRSIPKNGVQAFVGAGLEYGLIQLHPGDTMADDAGHRSEFGERVAALRRERGWTQRELAPKLGISQRMLAYYEKRQGGPPGDLLEPLTKAFGVSVEVLLGFKGHTGSADKEALPSSPRLWRRVRQIEGLPMEQRKAILKLLDGLMEHAP